MKARMVVVAVMTAWAGLASAQTYVEGDVGYTKVKADCTGTLTCKASDRGYKLALGYQFHNHLGLEIGYMKFGKARMSFSSGSNVVSRDFESDAYFVAGTYRLPLGFIDAVVQDVSAVFRVGVANVDTKQSDTVSGTTTWENATEVHPVLGLGLEYALDQQWAVSTSIDQTKTALLSQTGHGNVRIWSFGARRSF